MSLSSPLADPGFFGKDDFVPFIGQVENVNDPKRSGRVKVRCIGWHPKEVKDLPTDELPWARVGMPTTHAQIGRVGGKHGLLPGSWVMGFFLDGHDAQKPFVLSSFNATSNASEESNTSAPTGNKGKLNVDDGAFKKKLGPQNLENPSHKIADEVETKLPTSEADKSADNPTHNALSPCEGGGKPNQSALDRANTEEDNGPDNLTSLNWTGVVADPKCGASAHASERIQVILKELIPNEDARFVFNDVVYSSITGRKVNLNSTLALVAKLICDVLKDSIEVLRGFVNDTIQRPIKSVAITAATGRDYPGVKIADQTSKVTIDTVNKVITEVINGLCEFIFNLLKLINNQTDDGRGNNIGGSVTATGLTPIGNIGADCVAALIIENVLSLVTAAISGAIGFQYSTGVEIFGLLQDLADGDGDFESVSGILDSVDDILGGLGLNPEFVDQLSSIFQFITQFKFTSNPQLFTTFGPFVLDLINTLSGDDDGEGIDGCNKEGLYVTGVGLLSSILSGQDIADLFLPEGGPTADFGGLPPGSNTGVFSSQVCDAALGTKIPGIDFPSTACKADVITVSVPSSEPNAAQNFINGIANSVVIRNPGCEFFFGRGDQILYDISALLPRDNA